MSPAFSEPDIKQRRAASRRLAWGLGMVALALYLIGLFIKR